MSPAVSVLLPYRNAADTLEEAIESVLEERSVELEGDPGQPRAELVRRVRRVHGRARRHLHGPHDRGAHRGRTRPVHHGRRRSMYIGIGTLLIIVILVVLLT